MIITMIAAMLLFQADDHTEFERESEEIMSEYHGVPYHCHTVPDPYTGSEMVHCEPAGPNHKSPRNVSGN